LDDSGKAGRDWTRALREAAPYLGIGTSLAVTVVLGVGIGYWLDGKFGTEPIFFLVGALLGLLAAGVQFYRLVAVRKQ
jgi:ATP synthase protein I